MRREVVAEVQEMEWGLQEKGHGLRRFIEEGWLVDRRRDRGRRVVSEKGWLAIGGGAGIGEG